MTKKELIDKWITEKSAAIIQRGQCYDNETKNIYNWIAETYDWCIKDLEKLDE
jgi:hypothetical protein